MTTAVIVTIPAATFARDARKHADEADRLASAAAAALTKATHRVEAMGEGSDWRSPGGATAAEVLAMVTADALDSHHGASLAEAAARRAEATEDATAAAGAEHEAKVYLAAVKHASAFTERVTDLLPH